MALLRVRAVRILNSLSTVAMQSTKEPLLSSAANGIPLRAMVGYIPSRVSKFQWGVLNGSSYSSASESKNNNNPGETKRKRPVADVSSLFPGRDDKHWLVILNFPEGEPTKQEMIDRYVKLVATVKSSEEEAIKSIYSVNFDKFRYFGFGCEMSKEDAEKVKGLPGVFKVFMDSWVDPVNKDYGGELFIDGKIVQRSPERQKLIDRTPPPSESSKHRARSRMQAREEQGPIDLTLASVDG